MQKFLCLSFLVFLAVPRLFAEDWTQWRGPNRDGKIESKIHFTKSTQFKTEWTAEVGIGFSSMVVADVFLVTLGHADEQDKVTCLNALTGEKILEQSYVAALDPNLFEGGPTSTPAISEGKVYTISRKGLIHCFALKTGDIVWQYNIVKELKLNVPTWGFAGSPLIVGEQVIFNAGSHGLCLNSQSGELVWSSTNDVDAGYSSPLLVKTKQTPHVVFLNAKAVNAVDPSNGELIWSERWITRYGINAADPLVLNDHQLLVSSGYGKGTGLIEFDKDKSELVWRNRDVRIQMSPGVLVNDAIYAIDGDADEEPSLVCFDPQTGTPFWREEKFGAGTLLVVNSQILVLKETGELVVIESNQEKFEVVVAAKVSNGKCWTPPVMVGNHLYKRNALGKITCSSVH